MSIDVGVKSDRSIMNLEMSISGNKRGPGIWRLNSSVRQEKNIQQSIREEINAARNERGEYKGIKDPGLLLEVLFGRVCTLCIIKSKQITREKYLREKVRGKISRARA